MLKKSASTLFRTRHQASESAGHQRSISPSLLVIIPLTFLAVFYIYPLLSIVRLSLSPHGIVDMSAFGKVISSSYYLRTLWFTIWQAVVSTGLTLAAGLPTAYVFSHYDFRGKSLLRSLTTIPFVLPTVVVAAAFTSLIGPNGIVNSFLMNITGISKPPVQLMGTIGMILLAHVFFNFAVVLRIVGSFWANLDESLENAAAVLGADKIRRLFEVTFPLLSPSILAAALLVFIFDFTSFGVILILGGSQFATIEVEIYRQTVNVFNLPVAAALSMLQIIFTMVLTVVYTRIQAQSGRPLNFKPSSHTIKRPVTIRAKVLVALTITMMSLLLFSPLAALLLRTFTAGIQPLMELFINRRGSYFYVPPVDAIRNSLVIALITVISSLGLGTIAAVVLTYTGKNHGRSKLHWSSLLDPLFMLPLGTSAVTLGFGYIISLDTPPLDLRSSALILPIAHTLVAFPFVVRSLLPVLRGIRADIRSSASVLGASPIRVWYEVDLPIVGRAMLVAATFAFAISLGEFSATALVARPEFPTISVVIYRFLSVPGALNYGQAMVMSTFLMIICSVGIMLIERARFGNVGEF